MILVDTSVWSLALRRTATRDDDSVRELGALITEGRASICGPIRQELLSGVKSEQQFELLKSRLREFPDLPVTSGDYEDAAAFFNQCRRRGVQGSNTDFLICAISVRHRMPVLTADRDFDAFARVLPLSLHKPRA